MDDTPWPDLRRHAAPLKGRGTATQWPHRHQCEQRVREDAPWSDDDEPGASVAPPTEVRLEHAVQILSRNDSPDIPFRWSINPYRGCEHGCIYCYARPTHSHLNLSPGLDFETRLVAKANAVERLKQALSLPRHDPSPIHLGAATDAYQPIEREHGITRGLLEVLLAHRHACSVVTKSAGILRDIDLLAALAAQQLVYVMVSLTTLDSGLSRLLEPRAAAPQRRLEVVRRLTQAGVPVGVNVAPIIPFVNEPEIERLVAEAAQAGARSLHYTVVRLPWEVAPLFRQWLSDHRPDQAARVMARIQDMHSGRDYDPDFAGRMKGRGVWADLIRQRVQRARMAHGLSGQGPRLDTSLFTPTPGQGQLF
ncbi:MAG: hypothetical protein RLZZ182_361 [Pseudomonadota bacterium]|jgi:DNA repair photolyase